MPSSEFEELITQVRQVGQQLSAVFKELTGEELDVESAVQHYPLVALGLAMGAGLVGGWWIGHRSARRLPPPKQQSPVDGALEWLRGLGTKLGPQNGPHQETPLERLEHLLPGSSEAVRDFLPDITAEEAAFMARDWLSNVIEPRLRQGIEEAVDSASKGGFGAFLRQALQRLDSRGDTELEDPGTA